MGTTTLYGFPYPEPDDPVDVPGDIQALAEAVETTVSGLITDTGRLTDLAITAGTDWSLTTASYRTFLGKIIVVDVIFLRTGADVTVSSGGNIVGDPVLGTVTDTAKRPTTNVYGAYHASLTSGSVVFATDGVIKIYDGHSSGSIRQNDSVYCHFVFDLP